MVQYDMVDYTKEELKQLQDKSLEMARYFVEFCKQNDLLCYFCGGGCIGAIRHKGFIPWDDDLDFFMPRKDYEKLEKLWKEKADTKKYSINRPSKELCDGNCMITIKDEETTFIKPYQQHMDISHGLPLDVFPLDGLPKSKIKRKMQLIYAMVYSLFVTQVVPSKHGEIMTLGCKILLGVFRTKQARYKIWKFCERRMSRFSMNDCEYTTELCAGPHYMKKEYPTKCFKKAKWVQFEDTTMPIPVGYDRYLKTAFGDYMKLPPKEKQKAHHECVFMDLNKSYKDVKGIYYYNKMRGK